MKNFTSFQSINEVKRAVMTIIAPFSTRVWTLIAPMLFVAFGLFGVNESAWAWRGARVYAKSSPSTGGTVDVSTGSANGYSTSEQAESSNLKIGTQSFSFKLYYNTNTTYTFKGWSTSQTANTGNSGNPKSISVNGISGLSYTEYTYYAIFARLTANESSLAFGEKNVDQGWGNSQSVKVTYVHTGETKATISGTNADDFAFKSNDNYVKTITVASNSTNTETTDQVITIYFNPQCNGTRTATLTFSGNGLTKSVTLTGTGVLNAQTLSWNNESSIEVNMKHESEQYISASSTSGLAVSYSTSNDKILYVHPTSGKLSTRGLGTATITVTQAGNCKYSAATPITKTFTVSSKATPIFTPNGFDDSETKQLKVGDKVTLEVEYVSNGLNGDFTATASKDNMLSFTRSGNIITIEALNAGSVTATFKQKENSGFYGVTKNYSFSISKYQPSFSGSDYNFMVGASQIADYDFKNVSTTTLTGDSNDELYYTIDEVSLNEIHNGNNLITFDPSTKRITACNAGTCKITLHQKETYKYAGATKSFNVTVHKYNSVFAGMNDFGVKVEASQASSYTLTYTKDDGYIGENILAGTPSANSSDDLYYTLTQNVTSGNTTGSADASKAIEYNAGTKTATGKNAGTGTVHIYQKETYKYNAADEDFVVTVTKNDPVFTWNNNSSTYYHNTSVANVCSSTNTDFAFTIGASTDANVAKESGNTLSVLSKNGSANFTVSQTENYKWNSKSQTFTVTPVYQSNHVPFTVSSMNKSAFEKSKTSNTSWDTNGYKLGEGGVTDKEANFVIGFTGIPEYVTFTKHLDKIGLSLPVGSKAIVYESADNSTWTQVWSNEERTEDVNSGNVSLSPTTRYLKFYYKGSIYCHFNNIKVTELKKFVASPISLDFGTKEVNEEVSAKTISLNYANAGHNITLTTNDAHFTVSPTTITSIGGEKTGTYTPITVTYSTTAEHKSNGAKLTISDELGNSKDVSLSGETKKRTPTVTWSSNDATFNVDDVLSATNANGLTVTLSVASADAAYVECEGNTATMIAAKAETVTITAHVTGNEIYADADFTKDITITNKTKQYITWEQDFSRLKTTDASKSITLNATSDSGLPVSYELIGDQTGLTLTQSGDVWTLTYSATECKNTTIVASQAGDEDYAPASSVSLPVKVVDPTKVCDENEVLVNSRVTISDSYVTYNIDIPASMTVSFSRVKTGLSLSAIYLFGVDVEFYSGRNGTGTKLYTKSYSASDINTSISNSTINLSSYINAKSVKIITEASNGYYIDAVSYTHRKYCTISASSLDFTTYPNTKTAAQTFNVNYANYPILLECSNDKFAFSPSSFGDCSEYGTQAISVEYTAGPNEGNDVGYLYIKDNTGKTLQTCTLNVTISKVAQNITSHNILNSYKTTDKVTLSAEANSHLTEFTYSADPAGVASFNGAEMTFAQSGTIAITVSQAGNNVYNPTSATVSNVVVSKVTPDISTAPTGTGLTYLQTLNASTLSGGAADVTLRGVEHTSVAGTFAWTTPSQQITEAYGSRNYSVTFTPTDGGMYTTKEFTIPINIARANQSIEMSDGSVGVRIIGQNEEKIDLSSLIISKTTDPIEANRAGAITYEVISDNKTNATIDGNYFYAIAGGEYTIQAKQEGTDYYNQATDDFVVTVNRVTPTVSNSSVKTLKVDDTQDNAFTLVNTQDLIAHINIISISDVNNGDGQVIEYDAVNNQIIAHNAGVVEIYLEQPQTGTINAYNSPVFTYTVEKYENSFTCSWGAWSKEANFNDKVSVAVTTTKADYAHSPIVPETSTADSLLALMTSVDETHFTMTASVNVGISTWHLTQAEDYKYLAATHDIQLIVKASTTECLIYNNPTVYEFSTDINDYSGHFEDENKHEVSGPADKIYFEAKKSALGVNKFVVEYTVDGSNWRTIVNEPDLSYDYKTFCYTFSELPGENALQENEEVAYIRFGANTGATLTKWYKNVKISRKTWLKAVDAYNAELDTIVMPEIAIGNTTTATFHVNYSTCDNVIRMTSSNEHFTLSTADMPAEGDNIGNPTEITITYSNPVASEDTATITVYTKYENTTFTVVGKTIKKEQSIEWQEGFTDRPLLLLQGTASTNEHPAAKATSGESVVYTTDNPAVIKITLGGLGFTVIGNGTAQLCASEAGSAIWKPVSDTITIMTTGRRIQQIVWDQNFKTVDWEIGQDTTLEAKVYLYENDNWVFSQERTDSIVYSCTNNNGVISIDTTSMTILGYGKTTVTASVLSSEEYEDAQPVTLLVKVRQPSEGCESEPVLEINENVQLFSMDFSLSNNKLTTPMVTSDVIELDASKGKPDKLSYLHNAEAFTVRSLSFCAGTVYVQQRINGVWSTVEGSEYTTDAAYDWRNVDGLELDERANAIQFVREDQGAGYHNFQGIQITLKHYLRSTQSVFDLGEIQIGEKTERTIGFEYSDVKAELQVGKTDPEDDMLSIDDNDIDSIACGAHGQHDISIVFLPSKLGEWSDSILVVDTISKDTASVLVKATVISGSQFVFEKPGRWVHDENWRGDALPGENNAVLISADAEIKQGDTISVESMTITEDVTVTVHGVLTLGNTNSLPLSKYGNLHVADSGKIVMGEGRLLVNDFIIDANLCDANNQIQGTSGQVENSENKLHVRGDAYFQMTFDPSGAITYGWYDFTVPFQIGIANGIYRVYDNVMNPSPLTENGDFKAIEFDPQARADGGRGWRAVTGKVMRPGELYSIGFDDAVSQNTFRFKWNREGDLSNGKSFSTSYVTGTDADASGFNGFGNGMLRHGYAAEGYKKLIYNHNEEKYDVIDEAKTFAIGTAFFIQVASSQTILWTADDATDLRPMQAPKRGLEEIEEFRLILRDEKDATIDKLFFSASEEATDEYVIGRDLIKFGTPTTAKVAQMWATKGGRQLCDIETPLVGNDGYAPLTFFAPKDGEYTIAIDAKPEDAKLYLTYNGQVIWNLSASPYTFDLTQGTTEGYGLRLKRAPQSTTDLDETGDDSKSVRKVIINDMLYIVTPEGAIYNIIGKNIK